MDTFTENIKLTDKRVLFINGSLHSTTGNTFSLVNKLCEKLPYKVSHLDLTTNKMSLDKLVIFMESFDAFIFGSGVYWQSWSSYLQIFFESIVSLEGHKCFLGKPACCIVTMHSVGGLEVLSRMQSNLSMFGFIIPPMCSIVHSYVNVLARQVSDDGDIWDERYLDTIAYNFIASIEKLQYKAWDVETVNNHVIWCN